MSSATSESSSSLFASLSLMRTIGECSLEFDIPMIYQ